MTIEEYIREEHPESTAKTYLYYIEQFTRVNREPENMTYRSIVEYMDELERRGKSNDNRKVILNAIKRYFDYVCDVMENREDHPCEKMYLRGGRTKDVQLNNIFTKDELELLLERNDRYSNIRRKNKLLVSLMVYQGLSPHEICAMKVSDVDLDTGVFVARGTKKIEKRKLELRSMQTLLLFRYLEDRDTLLDRTGLETDNLFITHFGTEQTVDSVNRMFRPYKHLFPDRTLNPQNIRMSVVYRLVNDSNLRLEVAMERAGLKWMSSIGKYLRVDREGDLKIVQEMHPFEDLF